MDEKKSDITGIGDILKSRQIKKPPAYAWQDLALRVVKELKIPPFKKGAVFKVCKEHPSQTILNAMNDTKELCKTKGAGWKYFFKIIGSPKEEGADAQDRS
ncbi:hypothetical protein A2303_06320 [Candidatus Falkowbacteria bacterium RIFOXYB2_FULL_47_14]|uniref:Uncharacterized protein n=1 Tax=Candidatus Falkowbacteria bacterium RIFOXYA2_FULL_47_19 TaxID=1797994 RepID=A0A1F5SMN5_9BACT|nr:MAG: hypothetical protein A2227_05075 [Candidatus Falkowbacteria bacterium RIFOXYA2_FULL_47_19]OGF35107.1 MAG: hypothetical protein A2468_03930 [Candidatus Falkowbacteria bacterium RIFOXYC2_FULL_46_15]OGF43175.1 MAG: hypothetical protein A2303_06320 [Candidatus Falkowbacteria bacterium RIFOXYB2_FULL_47_14]